jgi:three-Cys-motif partner protein
MAPRSWGWWTKHKLEILQDYLEAFARASNKVDERIYLDLFAGAPDNQERGGVTEILGSVHRALGVQPQFTRVCLFEVEPIATDLEKALQQRYPERPGIEVFHGDCNLVFGRAAARLASVRWAPTFAFIDQYDNEIHWKTLEQIARFRRGKTKAEMWLLFGTSFYLRGLRARSLMDARYGDSLTEMFGSDEWMPIIRARHDDRLDAAQARDELLNLMRWRLEKVLGYRASHPFVMRNTNGSELYQMIFVSDHPAGDQIMRDLYGKAMLKHEVMRQHALAQRREARLAERGQHALFGLGSDTFENLTVKAAGGLYVPEPPVTPYGSR